MKWLLTAAEGESRAFHHYLDWVQGAGVAVDVVRPSQPLPSAEEFEALLLTGGGDVDPSRYGRTPHRETGSPQPDRDEMEFRLVERFSSASRPVLGICRGLQVVQAFLGGRLIQHVPDLVSPDQERHSASGKCDSIHPLIWHSHLPMAVALAGKATECNSAHHQAADPAELAPGLIIAASSGCGIVEALEASDDDASFISCVQWHPERLELDKPASGALRAYWVEQVGKW